MTTTSQHRFVRHWKEVFDETSDFVFIKRLRLGLPNKPIALPGEEVTQEIKDFLGEHRLKVWWEARVIGSKDYAIALGLALKPQESSIVPTGRGWFAVKLPSGEFRRVRGRAAAEDLLSNA